MRPRLALRLREYPAVPLPLPASPGERSRRRWEAVGYVLLWLAVIAASWIHGGL